MKRLWLLALILMISLGLSAERKALVIGNAVYDGVTLASPINDSNDMEAALGNWGFTITKRQNLDLRAMTAVIDSFIGGITKDDEVFFYYSGHGTRDPENYLVPSGVNMLAKQTYSKTAYPLGQLINRLAKSKSAIVMLEASRQWLPVTPSSGKFFTFMTVPDSSVAILSAAKPHTVVNQINPLRSAFTQAFITKVSQSQASFNEIISAWTQELSGLKTKSFDPWFSEKRLKPDIILNQPNLKYKFKNNVMDLEGGGSISW